MRAPNTIWGPKGILVLRVDFFFNNELDANNNPEIDDRNNITGIDCHPKKQPKAVINFASPNPIASIFFKFLYIKIIIQIEKYPTKPPIIISIIFSLNLYSKSGIKK